MRAMKLFVQAALGLGVFLGHALASAADAPGPLIPLAKDPTRDPASIHYVPIAPLTAPKSMVPTSGTLLGLGVATMIGGGIMMAVAPTNEELCGVAGCYETPDNELRTQGYLTLATGAGFSIVSGLALLHSALSDREPHRPRYSDDMTSFGIGLTALGSGLAALSVTAAAADNSRYGFFDTPSDLLVISALSAWVVLPVGITLWCYGAHEPKPENRLSLRVGPTSAHFSLRF